MSLCDYSFILALSISVPLFQLSWQFRSRSMCCVSQKPMMDNRLFYCSLLEVMIICNFNMKLNQ